MIEIRDTSGDHQRQQEIASKIFTALESAGWWRAVYIDDMQKSPGQLRPRAMTPRPAHRLRSDGRRIATNDRQMS